MRGIKERFTREVAAVIDADTEAELPRFATMYVPGRSLAEAVRTDGPLPEPQVRRLGAGLVEALQAIHAARVVHRDLKPANVLLAPDGPRVIDFEISRVDGAPGLTSARATFGPGVLAPAARPPAEAWLRALNKERSQVRICALRPLHAYGSHLTSCPWCTRAATTGHDVFNGPAPLPLPDPPSREEERPDGRLSPALKVALLVALVVALAVVARQLGGG